MGGSSLPGQSSLLQTHWLFRQMLVEREAQVMGGSAEAGIHERIWRGHRHPTAPKEGYGTRKSPKSEGASGGDGAPSGASAAEESERQCQGKGANPDRQTEEGNQASPPRHEAVELLPSQHTHTHTRTRTYTNTHIHTHAHTYMHRHTNTCAHTCTPIHIYINTTHTHTHINTHIQNAHTYTHILLVEDRNSGL